MIEHIGFTGTREGMTQTQLVNLKQVLHELRDESCVQYFHHGDCIGADEEAHVLARCLGYKIVLHPPDSPKFRANCDGVVIVYATRPYLERNQQIVNDCGFMIAAPKEEHEVVRSGTWSTIRRAQEKGCDLTILRP